MTLATNKLGEHGERVAGLWLATHGWSILARRFRSGHRDIDLIAAKLENPASRTVAFVEVKTRRSEAFGGPLGAINWKKQREIGRSAWIWISRFRRPGDQYRFDVIGVLFRQGRVRVRHIENAFQVSSRT